MTNDELRALLEETHPEFVALVHRPSVEGIVLHEAGYKTDDELMLLARMIKFAAAHGLEVTVIPHEELNRFRHRLLYGRGKATVN